MSGISTHILDTSLGRPAAAVIVQLAQQIDGQWQILAERCTDEDGRIKESLPESSRLTAAIYRLSFQTNAYFAAQKLQSLYPVIEITFVVRDPAVHHHIPLLLAAHGYSTYRGS